MIEKRMLIHLIEEVITKNTPKIVGINELAINIADYLISNDILTLTRGKWVAIKDNTFLQPSYECSVCGRRLNTWGKPEDVAPFCHCGARMDEVSE